MASVPSGSHVLGAPLDALLERMVAESDGVVLAAARADYEARTGAFAPEDPWFEERARAAFETAVLEHGTPRGVLLAAWASRHAEHAAAVEALGRAFRGLFRVERTDEERVRVTELLGGAPMRLEKITTAARLREGDRFDGRIVHHDGALRLLPGIVFHPAESHVALDELLAAARAANRSDPSILDGLLRMRMRFDRFTGMAARHVYRWDAIDKTEILAASWARPRP